MGASLLFILSGSLAYFSCTNEVTAFTIFMGLIYESAIAYYVSMAVAVVLYLFKTVLNYKKIINTR